MSHALFSRNADLKRLRDEGYLVHVQGGFLVMEEIPYVNAQGEVLTGRLISSLTLAGDETRQPDNHVIHFDGDFPCRADGVPIQAIAHQTNVQINLGLRSASPAGPKPPIDHWLIQNSQRRP